MIHYRVDCRSAFCRPFLARVSGRKSAPRLAGLALAFLAVIVPSAVAAVGNRASPAAEFQQMIAWQSAQEPPAYRTFAGSFIGRFNAGKMDEIARASAPEMLDKTSAEKLAGFLNSLQSENGKIASLSYKYFAKDERSRSGKIASYRLRFDSGSYWTLRVALDDQGRMDRFLVVDPNFNEDLPLISAKSRLELPFAPGEAWYVLWGGDSEEQNYHVISRSQKNAFDLVIRNPWSQRSFRTDGASNEDFFAFGRPLFSPVAGQVVKVRDGVQDNKPGVMNPDVLTGNTIVIKTDRGEYVLLAHLQNGSIRVREGSRVKVGTLLGKCGNSGNSSEPHLHLQVMDGPDMAQATGLKAHFSSLTLNRESRASNYSPVRGNIIQRP